MRGSSGIANQLGAQKSWTSGGLLAIGRREGTKLGYGGGDDFEGEVDIEFGGMPAEAKAEAGLGFLVREADSGENMRRFDSTGRTRCTDRTSQTLQVESNDQGFSFDA